MKNLCFFTFAFCLAAIAVPFPVGFNAARSPLPPPPDAPASLTIPGHNQTDQGDMPLSWTASAGATSYKIYRSTMSGSGYTLMGTSAVTTYTNGFPNACSACVPYYYVVTAVNSGGESGYSPEASGENVSPSSSLTGGSSGADAVLNWDTPPECNAIVSIRRATSPGGPYDEVGTAGASETTFTDSTPGTGAFYYVIVFNTPVHQSQFSNEVEVDL